MSTANPTTNNHDKPKDERKGDTKPNDAAVKPEDRKPGAAFGEASAAAVAAAAAAKNETDDDGDADEVALDRLECVNKILRALKPFPTVDRRAIVASLAEIVK